MITKIKAFKTYKDYNEPLSDLNAIEEISISRNGSIHVASNDPNTSYTEPVLRLDLYSNEDIDHLTIKVSENASYSLLKDIEENNETHYIITVVSESGVSKEYRLIVSDIGLLSNDNTLYSIIDQNTNKSLKIHTPIEQNGIFIGFINYPVFLTNEYFNPLVNANSSDISYVAFNNVDPDNETVDNITLSLMDINEIGFLDHTHVYLKINGSDGTIYYKLIKGSQRDSLTPLNEYKETLSDLYVHRFGDMVVKLESLTFEQLKEVNNKASLVEIKDYFTTNNIEIYNISGYESDLIDEIETEKMNNYSLLKAFNITSNNTFLSSEVDNIGKSIAFILKSVIDNLDGYDHTKLWLNMVYEDNINERICTTTIDKVLSEIDLSILYNNFNVRHFNDILVRLKHIEKLLIDNMIVYSTSLERVSYMIYMIEKQISIKNSNVLNIDIDTIKGFEVFMTDLPLLKKKESSIQRISW